MQTVMDRRMKELTSKQWFVLLALDTFEKAPKLKELADLCDYSHQNTKQIINRLKEKDFVTTVPDEVDKRSIRIISKEKFYEWEKDNRQYASHFIDIMFDTLSEKEIRGLSDSLLKIYQQLGVLSNEK